MVEQVTPELVTRVLRRHQNQLGLTRIEHVRLAVIGRGEANLNLRVELPGTAPLNLRVGLRGDESVQALRREFAILAAVPAGLAPRAYVQDSSGEALPYPYLLLEYLPGAPSSTWSQADYRAHAYGLARLHAQTYPYHGELGQAIDAPLDMVGRFDASLRYWEERTPELFELPMVLRLCAPVRQYMLGQNMLFTGRTQFSLIHGDAHWRNILFHAGRAYYIDWEWASVGDPACDVAKVAWDVATGWQFQLGGDQLDRYLAAYLQHLPDPTLQLRREVWMVYTMFFDQLYHRTQLDVDRANLHARTVQRLEAYLAQRFL